MQAKRERNQETIQFQKIHLDISTNWPPDTFNATKTRWDRSICIKKDKVKTKIEVYEQCSFQRETRLHALFMLKDTWIQPKVLLCKIWNKKIAILDTILNYGPWKDLRVNNKCCKKCKENESDARLDEFVNHTENNKEYSISKLTTIFK